jgi:hypothetical protein
VGCDYQKGEKGRGEDNLGKRWSEKWRGVEMGRGSRKDRYRLEFMKLAWWVGTVRHGRSGRM